MYLYTIFICLWYKVSQDMLNLLSTFWLSIFLQNFIGPRKGQKGASVDANDSLL